MGAASRLLLLLVGACSTDALRVGALARAPVQRGMARLPARVPAPLLCDATAAGPTAGIVTFSERAMKQLETMKSSQDVEELTLRMGVRAGGCSGMSYVMELAKPGDDSEGDTVIELAPGYRCLIDPKSLMFLYGLRLDYSDELIGGGFSFQNPNAESECGCGKSFGV